GVSRRFKTHVAWRKLAPHRRADSAPHRRDLPYAPQDRRPAEKAVAALREKKMAKLARLERHLSAGTTGLVLFDALNGYLHPDNPAKVKFLGERNIIGNLQRLLEGARKVGMTAFYP